MSLLVAVGAAVVLIFLPLAVAELRRRATRRGPAERAGGAAIWTVVYFGSIGLGFMGIEMALISWTIRWLGDPVIASAGVIGGVLILSGAGSLSGQRVVRGRVWLAPAVVAAGALLTRLLGWQTLSAGPWLLLAVTVPAAYFMGMPMPTGLAALNERAARLVPWAWGINGVASVIATSAAIVVAMTTGYRAVILLAAGAYALAALAAAVQARQRTTQG